MAKSNGKIVLAIRTKRIAIRLFKQMANEARHDYGDEFELLVQAEYKRRHPSPSPQPQTEPKPESIPEQVQSC